VTWYFSGPFAAALLIAISTLTILVTTVFGVMLERLARRLEIHAPTGVVRATVQAMLAVALVLDIPTAAVLALEPFRSDSLGWILVGIWLAAVTALVCSVGAPTIGTPPEPRLVAAAGLFVTGVALILASRLDGQSLSRAGIALAILVGVWLAWLKRVELGTAALVTLALMILVALAGPQAAARLAVELVRLALGAFAGCVLAAAGIGLAAYAWGRRTDDALPGWWGWGVPLALVLGAAAAPFGAVAVSSAVSVSMLGIAAVIGGLSVLGFRSALAR
jgi:hypothetical protein